MTKFFDYIFVGAGPASLMAAKILGKSAGEILLVDAGSAGLTKRTCPGLKSHACSSCSHDICPVTMGVGGSSAGFGNKLCRFPASREVLNFIPSHIRDRVTSNLDDVFGDSRWQSDDDVVPHIGAAARKFYTADRLFRREYQALLARLISSLDGVAAIRGNTAVKNVRRRSDGLFHLTCNDGEVLFTRKLAVACGRSGHMFLRSALMDLGAGFAESHMDIGIRLEAPTEFFSSDYFYQVDPKFKFAHGDLGTSRTFCSCKDGVTVPVKFGNASYIDGAFTNVPTGRTNVALMVRPYAGAALRDIEAWCGRLNERTGGSLLLGEFTLSADVVNTVMTLVGDWSDSSHALLMRKLLENVVDGRYLNMFKQHCSSSARVKVFGPAIDLYWPRPSLVQGFGVREVDGLFVLGDATGVSRGIVQALASGAGWAHVELEAQSAWGVAHAVGE